MEPQYLYTRSVVKVQVPAATVVKVVVVAAIAAYFGRSLVSVIDENLGRLNKKVEEASAKMQQDSNSK